MEMRKCPECAEFVHFDAGVALKRCWCCGILTDFSRIQSTSQKLQPALDATINLIFWPLSSCVRVKRAGEIAFAAALPVAAIMLLICNSFDISIVNERIEPFLNFGDWVLRGFGALSQQG